MHACLHASVVSRRLGFFHILQKKEKREGERNKREEERKKKERKIPLKLTADMKEKAVKKRKPLLTD